MLKINPVRTARIPHNEEDGSEMFAISFKFLAAEEQDIETIQKIIASAPKLKDGESGEEKIAESAQYKLLNHTLRSSISDWSGIVDDEGSPISLRNADGEIISEHQIIVWEAVRRIEGYMDKVITAYVGPSSKN